MAWLNVDKATRKCTVHDDPNCQYVVGMAATPLKGIGQIRDDGGWLDFPTLQAAHQHAQANWPNYRLTDCCP
jgi:hypothetical protein